MSDRLFLKAMFEDGATEFSWAFAVGWLSEAIDSYLRGISTSKQLAVAHSQVEYAVIAYNHGVRVGLTEQQIADSLRIHANNDPVGSDSPTRRGRTPR